MCSDICLRFEGRSNVAVYPKLQLERIVKRRQNLARRMFHTRLQWLVHMSVSYESPCFSLQTARLVIIFGQGPTEHTRVQEFVLPECWRLEQSRGRWLIFCVPDLL